jgi:hypothetical protein
MPSLGSTDKLFVGHSNPEDHAVSKRLAQFAHYRSAMFQKSKHINSSAAKA